MGYNASYPLRFQVRVRVRVILMVSIRVTEMVAVCVRDDGQVLIMMVPLVQ